MWFGIFRAEFGNFQGLSNDLINYQNAAVSTALPLTSANCISVDVLSITSADPVVQTLIDKVNEVLLTMRR